MIAWERDREENLFGGYRNGDRPGSKWEGLSPPAAFAAAHGLHRPMNWSSGWGAIALPYWGVRASLPGMAWGSLKLASNVARASMSSVATTLAP